MITYKEMVGKIGKRKAIETVVNHRCKEKTNFDKTRGIKGRVKWRTCGHGTWIIENYEPRICKFCEKDYEVRRNVFSVRSDGYEYFNIGTGTYGTHSEHRKAARQQGLEEAG